MCWLVILLFALPQPEGRLGPYCFPGARLLPSSATDLSRGWQGSQPTEPARGSGFRCEPAVSHRHHGYAGEREPADAVSRCPSEPPAVWRPGEKPGAMGPERQHLCFPKRKLCSAVRSATCTLAASRPECPPHYSPEASLNTSHRKMIRSSDERRKAFLRKWFEVFKQSIS